MAGTDFGWGFVADLPTAEREDIAADARLDQRIEATDEPEDGAR